MYVEIKEHAPEQPMGQWRNQKRNEKPSWDKKKNGSTTCQNLWDATKVILEGSL